MFGKKTGGGSGGIFGLAQDGSFMLFGCLSLLFILMAAPLLALVIVGREGLAELMHNVAAAFAGDRLWILAVVIVAGAVVRYALAGPLVDWLKAREMASQEQIHYPPPPAIEIHNNRGFSPAEMQQLMANQQPKAIPAKPATPSAAPPHLAPRPAWLGGQNGENQGDGVKWRR